jgi:hypothetical protein
MEAILRQRLGMAMRTDSLKRLLRSGKMAAKGVDERRREGGFA